MTAPRIGLVLIGRNEGARLIRCLASVPEGVAATVYVDSGSTDNSVAEARKAGARVVELDLSRPFTAARARNEGYGALKETGKPLDYVQFVDGDCAIVEGWIGAAAAALTANPALGIVTGWRSEIHPEASVFNAMCDFEWHRPAGEILACGGDMMVRVTAFDAVGGFDDTVIAAEDDEFCTRIRKAGWKIERLPVDMTRHDAAMTRTSQWWRRAVRTGHGFAQVGDLHPEYFIPRTPAGLVLRRCPADGGPCRPDDLALDRGRGRRGLRALLPAHGTGPDEGGAGQAPGATAGGVPDPVQVSQHPRHADLHAAAPERRPDGNHRVQVDKRPMSQTPIRVGLIGAGYIATWHANALRVTKGVELTAICDISAAAAGDFAGGYGIRAFTSVEEMAAANVCDAVHILTPPHIHASAGAGLPEGGLSRHGREALRACRAPIAPLSRLRLEAAGRQVAVCHNFLGVPSYGRLKDKVRSGALGRIDSAVFNWRFPLAPLALGALRPLDAAGDAETFSSNWARIFSPSPMTSSARSPISGWRPPSPSPCRAAMCGPRSSRSGRAQAMWT